MCSDEPEKGETPRMTTELKHTKDKRNLILDEE